MTTRGAAGNPVSVAVRDGAWILLPDRAPDAEPVTFAMGAITRPWRTHPHGWQGAATPTCISAAQIGGPVTNWKSLIF